MTVHSFKDFISGIIVENLHPELQDIVHAKTTHKAKQVQLSQKIKELSLRGEKLGIERNMPKGSSRSYLKHTDDKDVEVDGKKTKLPVGTKVAIKSSLDVWHNKDDHGGFSLGALQNEAEAGDHYVNSRYRILTKDSDHPHKFVSNHEHGIFPPLIDHDHENHEWSHVGHVEDITGKQFRDMTRSKDYPLGVSHKDFYDTLMRRHNENNGRHWTGSKGREELLNKLDNHPLIKKFHAYHDETGNSPSDYHQLGNLGIWRHPDGSSHIVARDHGFTNDVANAYKTARMKMYTED